MDRQLIYTGAIPQDTDLLNTNKNTMIALGMAMQAVLGTGTWFDGLACAPTGVPSLQVTVAPGSVYSVQNVDSAAYGSIAADTAHQIVKQGISLNTLTLSCPAPATTGQSINYLIQGIYQDVDGGSTILPYYNASNPAVAYNGPANSGTSQNTVRQGVCTVSVKAGVAATTGSQTTPAPDAGYTGLWVVTVANGQTQITSPNIVLASGAPFITEKLNTKISQATADTRYLQMVNTRTRLTANTTYYVATTGNDSTGTGAIGAPWATIQKALNYIAVNIDLGGFIATVSVADGTYTSGVNISSAFVGAGTSGGVQLTGNTTTPANCIISTTSDCIAVLTNGTLSIAGFKLTSSAGGCIDAIQGGKIYVNGNMEYGACGSGYHIAAQHGSLVQLSANYKITGSAATHYYSVFSGSDIISIGLTVTITGSPTFSSSFAYASNLSQITSQSCTFSGATTATRYTASLNSVINSGGGGASYFPGTVAGGTATGGLYA